MALINTTTTGIQGTTIFADGTGSLTIQQNGVTLGTYGSIPAFSATRSAAQSIGATTYTKIQFSTEEFDTNNCYDPTTNYRFTPNVAGYYQITVNASTNSTQVTAVSIYKNGTRYRENYGSNPGIGANAIVTSLIFMNGTTDYVEAYIWQNSASNLYNTGIYYEFSGCLVRAA
jgi:hypothetical protein